MGDVILIRHGATEWSRDGRHTSYTDLPLLPQGEEQARALAPMLARHDIGLTLCSPLERARSTAKLAGLDPVRIEPDLHEWDYGGYEGVTTVDIHRTRPDWNLWTDGVTPGPEGHPGETPEQIGARADRVLATVHAALRESERDVVLVAHAHILRVLTARYLGLPPSAGALFLLATGTMSRLGAEHGQAAVAAWNERPR
ncbi:histidine phosphatase family protein [Streptacidiphilus sp. PB12-B1b]|uniref:histidine phosphatase family protein n=1 Tax=Streptacidiphilus sp. PB12-B1b TaxID=2705012 RepID=UPI0015F9BA89|nr:histidine phosphatase family protein [Streptacidiphilus sp. PB12-B1b]QMU76490.1 histidine phosphatase family protein [Streptacidiphilus sp. PB12-B1b]